MPLRNIRLCRGSAGVVKPRSSARHCAVAFRRSINRNRSITPDPRPTFRANIELIGTIGQQARDAVSTFARASHQMKIANRLIAHYNYVVASTRGCTGEARRTWHRVLLRRKFAKLLGSYIKQDTSGDNDLLAHLQAFAIYLDDDQTEREQSWDLFSNEIKLLTTLATDTARPADINFRDQLRDTRRRRTDLQDEAMAIADVEDAVRSAIECLSKPADSTGRKAWIRANRALADMLERRYQI